jgi:hypothetical protein
MVNKNQVCQFASSVKSMGENNAENDHMATLIKPKTWAIQLMVKWLLLACVSVISGCAMVIGHGNAIDESDLHSKVQTIPELQASEQEAVVVIVHEYFKRCCGGSASVMLQGIHSSGLAFNGKLNAMDDFVCWRLPPGKIKFIPLVGDQSFEFMMVDLSAGQHAYFKLVSDLRKPYEAHLEPISQKLANYHIHKTLDRVRDFRTKGPSPEIIERIKAKGPLRVAKKLSCSSFVES